MIAVPGDTKSCIYSGCPGTMQFARGAQSADALAWLCSLSTKHVHTPAKRREDGGRATAAPKANRDEGGTTPRDSRTAKRRLNGLPATQRAEMANELRLLVEALDRRVPRLERLGEAQIVTDAAELRRQAVALLAELASLDPQTSDRGES